MYSEKQEGRLGNIGLYTGLFSQAQEASLAKLCGRSGGFDCTNEKRDKRSSFFGYPKEFAIFFNEVRNLKYSEAPEYEGYRRMFRRLGVILNINYETDVPKFN